MKDGDSYRLTQFRILSIDSTEKQVSTLDAGTAPTNFGKGRPRLQDLIGKPTP